MTVDLTQYIHRLLLWTWKVAPFPVWLRRLFLQTLVPRFLLGALAVIQNEQDEILLVRQTYRDQAPWGLPGGWIKSAESIQAGLVREVAEETGLVVTVGAVVDVRHGPYYGDVVIAFHCKQSGGALRPGNPEIDRAEYFHPDRLPALAQPYRSILLRLGHGKVELR